MMKSYIGMFKTEIKRMFSLKCFLSSVLFMIILLLLGAIMYFREYEWEYVKLYYIFEGMTVGGFFVELIYIPASLFASTNLCMDIRQKGYYLYSSRSGKLPYIISKILVGVLFAFVVTEVAFNIVVGLGACVMPIADADYYTGGADVFEDVLRFSPVLFFEMRIFFISLSTGLFTAVGMIITVAMPNIYIAVMSSFLASRIIPEISYLFPLPTEMHIQAISEGFIRVSSSALVSILYVFVFFTALTLVSSAIFVMVMKRRCYGAKG